MEPACQDQTEAMTTILTCHTRQSYVDVAVRTVDLKLGFTHLGGLDRHNAKNGCATRFGRLNLPFLRSQSFCVDDDQCKAIDLLLNLSLISFKLASTCDSPEQTPQNPVDAAARPVTPGLAWMIARYLAQATHSASLRCDVCHAHNAT